MNRLQLWGQSEDATLPRLETAEPAILTQSCGTGMQHALFAPLHYEPNYSYPLVVWLHGPGDRETQLLDVMPTLSMRNYVGVGPRGDSTRRSAWPSDSQQEAERAVFGCIEVARSRFNIAPHRIFLAGLDCGGSMAFRIGLNHPQAFAGLLSVGGPFPLGSMPLARLELARQLPLFIAQGRYSETYPVERTCDELRLFHSASLNVTLRQYPCGDELDSLMLRDMDAWMMEIVTGISSEPDSGSSYNLGQLN